MIVQYFKAQKSTKRYKLNQKVWIQYDGGNWLRVRHKWRGSGRYVTSDISKHNGTYTDANPIIGTYDYPAIDVDDSFVQRHGLKEFKNQQLI